MPISNLLLPNLSLFTIHQTDPSALGAQSETETS